MSWLPDDFVHPVYTPVPDTALHLRPIREADTALDYPAVMGSRGRLWEIFGPAWAWPKETMTYEEDRIDLLRHEKEIAAHHSFNYALLDEEETAVLGCVYIDPPERTGSDGEVCWWVVDDLVGGEVERARRAGAAVDRRRLALPAAPLSGPRHYLAGLARAAARPVTRPRRYLDRGSKDRLIVVWMCRCRMLSERGSSRCSLTGRRLAAAGGAITDCSAPRTRRGTLPWRAHLDTEQGSCRRHPQLNPRP